MLGTVYHTGYLTDDVSQAVAYYQTTFGGRLLKQTENDTGTKIAYVQAGASEVELIEPGDKGQLQGRTGLILDHIGYFVPDLDQAITDLKARGVAFATSEPTVSAVGFRMIFLDATSAMGTRIHLTEEKS